MLGLLYKLIIGNFTGCKHNYVLIDHGRVVNVDNRVKGGYRIWECTKCKQIKHNEWFSR